MIPDIGTTENWFAFGNCAMQDLANAVNESKSGVVVTAFWLSSPRTVLSYKPGACQPLFLWQEQLKQDLESRSVANQFLQIDAREKPQRVLLNLFHVEEHHYAENASGTIFYLPHPERADPEVQRWLARDCTPSASDVAIEDYLTLADILWARFSCPIDLIVRRSIGNNDFCYLGPWQKQQNRWLELIRCNSRPFLRVHYLDQCTKDSWYPYFRVERRGVFKKPTIIHDREHMSAFGMALLAEKLFGIPGRPAMAEDAEGLWSAYIAGFMSGYNAKKHPAPAFPVSKYLLKSLKDMLHHKLIPMADVMRGHLAYVKEQMPDTPYYQRYCLQCQAVIEQIEER